MEKLKKIILLASLICILSCSSAVAADWSIEVDGQKLNTEVKVIDGRSLIPLRTVGEALGLEVKYYESTKVITLKDPDYINLNAYITLNYEKNTYSAIVSGYDSYEKYHLNVNDFQMYVQPVNIDGRVYVPVRLICDSFGAPVKVSNNTISIGKCFTDSENSAKKINKLVYSENAVLYVPDTTEENTTNEYRNVTNLSSDEGKVAINTSRKILEMEKGNSPQITKALVAKSQENSNLYFSWITYKCSGAYGVTLEGKESFVIENGKIYTEDDLDKISNTKVTLDNYDSVQDSIYKQINWNYEKMYILETEQYIEFNGASIMKSLGY